MDNIRSVERSLNLLENLSNHPNGLGITELCKITDLSKSTVFRILNTLISLGYVEQDFSTSKYLCTFKLFEIGNRKTKDLDIVSVIHPYLEKICRITGETIHLVIQDGVYAIYIDKINPSKSIIMDTNIGMRKPLYCTANGKILLCNFSDKEIANIWNESQITKYTEYTNTNLSLLLDEIEMAKKNGYAFDKQEVELNIGCISVPIHNYSNKVIAAISLSYIISNTDEDKYNQYVSTLKNYSNILSKRFGKTLDSK